MPRIGFAHRQPPMASEAMVASAHPLASLAGVDVLRSGGNVVDAAVAMNALLTVTQPCYCGVGGDFFGLYHEAATGRVHFLNGAGRSGSRADLDELRRRGLEGVPDVGPASVSIPGVTRAWQMLVQRFGTRPLASLLEPAIHYATDGFPISDLMCQIIRERAANIRDPEWWRVFVPEGRFPRAGECFRQPDLAWTLKELGGDHDLFYRGRLARMICDALAGEGFLTLSDFEEHSGEWGEPIMITYRGSTVYETPPPTQGLAALVALNVLEGFDLASHPVHSADHLHLLLEATKMAYADRNRWIADPQHADVPIERLLGNEHAEWQRRSFDPHVAQFHPFGGSEGDTTGFVVADGRGNVLSGIQSLFKQFGSGLVVPGTGIVLHNRGASFTTDPDHPNRFAPRKRPFHTLMAGIVTHQTEPVIGYATSGGDGQAMFHVQGLTNLLDYGMDIQEAVERPRFAYASARAGESPGTFQLEGRVAPDVVTELERRGHQLERINDFAHEVGHAQGVTRRGGTLCGGADPRGDGAALGY